MALDAAGRLPQGSACRRQRLEAAGVLLQCGEPPALLAALRQHRPAADPLFASLASSRHISKRSWRRMPPLAGLAVALPAVLGCSEREARWLVWRLPRESRRRLHAFALALARMQRCRCIPALPSDVMTCLLTLFNA